MKKNILRGVLIVIGVAISVFGYNAYQQYKMISAVENYMVELVDGVNEALAKQNTLCAINPNTDECTCILETSGAEIAKTEEECISLASEASDIESN